MKNSSRFELKMARNFTRPSSGTLGSGASASTRRLNSSHDSSRLTNASAPRSAMAEGLTEQDAVADAVGAHDERQIPAVDHGLLDHDGAGQDDVRALGLETAELAALASREVFQPLAHGGDVG